METPRREITIKLTADLIHALLEGKRVYLDNIDYTLTILPPHDGLVLTLEKFHELRTKAANEGVPLDILIGKYVYEQDIYDPSKGIN